MGDAADDAERRAEEEREHEGVYESAAIDAMMPDPVPGHPTAGMHIWGWTTPEELEWLGEQAARMDSVAEIGSLHGRSAYMLLSRCPGKVWCVDPWNDEGGHGFRSFMGSCGAFDNLVAVQEFSPAAASLVPDIDMTFIDGDHSYESCKADILGWLPKTRKLICGHDYRNADGGFPGVARAVDETFGDAVYMPAGSSIWAVDLS